MCVCVLECSSEWRMVDSRDSMAMRIQTGVIKSNQTHNQAGSQASKWTNERARENNEKKQPREKNAYTWFCYPNNGKINQFFLCNKTPNSSSLYITISQNCSNWSIRWIVSTLIGLGFVIVDIVGVLSSLSFLPFSSPFATQLLLIISDGTKFTAIIELLLMTIIK